MEGEGEAAATRGNQRWTDDEIDKLRALVADNVPPAAIAEKLGRTKPSVVIKASDLNITSLARHDEMLTLDAKIEELRAEGLSISMVAKKLGITPSRVSCARRRKVASEKSHGRGDVWSQEDLVKLFRMRREGHSASQIGKAMGRSRNAVLGKLHRAEASDKKREKHVVEVLDQPEQKPRARVVEPVDMSAYSTCRFIAGDPLSDDPYCGAASRKGSSYCPQHHALTRAKAVKA